MSDSRPNSRANGPVTRTRTRTETYTVKVVTHTETEYFSYSTSHDDSGMISNDINTYDFIKITFKKSYTFGNAATSNAYDKQLNNFISRNKYRDAHFGYTEDFRLEGFTPKMLSINTTEHSWQINTCFYVTVSLLFMMSWPYRIWMESLCYRGEFTIKKIIYV